MTQVYYFISAENTEALESAPIFRVRVGSTARAADACADLTARALVDDSIYFCIKYDDSQEFARKLMRQNENRAFYDVTIAQLVKIIATPANVARVENLSANYKTNRDYLLRQIRGANILNL